MAAASAPATGGMELNESAKVLRERSSFFPVPSLCGRVRRSLLVQFSKSRFQQSLHGFHSMYRLDSADFSNTELFLSFKRLPINCQVTIQ